ncbi:16S rRNA (uracil(1498)-N(3))-methyltransferase [Demequina activiva]|uniref:Ribosomal RNA small subunit methyltransferase E n=1 Tax=Demequina activiva TaxID=1582364 RepID=A0A919Q4M5_9MICO|nr:16S rRNA (uracil(1498)-N(3))-methyltransferase [Demequina activiva]GIG55484.1 ribosomal RNA small subunit methyltransferase E [Demequina activiva]
MSAPVFLCPKAADARPGDVLAVDGDEGRHAVTVQRRAVGEAVDLVDGLGRRASGEIIEAGGGQMRVRVAAVAQDHDAEVVLVQALAKGGRDEQAVESAIELGATRIVPWGAQRSIVQWRGPKADKARDKWAALVVAATKQSRRARVASVDAVVSTAQLTRLVADAVGDGACVLVLHEAAAGPLTAVPWEDPRQPVWLIVGPEGGISDDELEQLRSAGARPVVLGPHVLRASSAGPAAIAALAAVRGTWDVASGEADGPADGGLR